MELHHQQIQYQQQQQQQNDEYYYNNNNQDEYEGQMYQQQPYPNQEIYENDDLEISDSQGVSSSNSCQHRESQQQRRSISEYLVSGGSAQSNQLSKQNPTIAFRKAAQFDQPQYSRGERASMERVASEPNAFIDCYGQISSSQSFYMANRASQDKLYPVNKSNNYAKKLNNTTTATTVHAAGGGNGSQYQQSQSFQINRLSQQQPYLPNTKNSSNTPSSKPTRLHNISKNNSSCQNSPDTSQRDLIQTAQHQSQKLQLQQAQQQLIQLQKQQQQRELQQQQTQPSQGFNSSSNNNNNNIRQSNRPPVSLNPYVQQAKQQQQVVLDDVDQNVMAGNYDEILRTSQPMRAVKMSYLNEKQYQRSGSVAAAHAAIAGNSIRVCSSSNNNNAKNTNNNIDSNTVDKSRLDEKPVSQHHSQPAYLLPSSVISPSSSSSKHPSSSSHGDNVSQYLNQADYSHSPISSATHVHINGYNQNHHMNNSHILNNTTATNSSLNQGRRGNYKSQQNSGSKPKQERNIERINDCASSPCSSSIGKAGKVMQADRNKQEEEYNNTKNYTSKSHQPSQAGLQLIDKSFDTRAVDGYRNTPSKNTHNNTSPLNVPTTKGGSRSLERGGSSSQGMIWTSNQAASAAGGMNQTVASAMMMLTPVDGFVKVQNGKDYTRSSSAQSQKAQAREEKFLQDRIQSQNQVERRLMEQEAEYLKIRLERSEKEVREKKRLLQENELYYKKIIDEKNAQIVEVREENRQLQLQVHSLELKAVDKKKSLQKLYKVITEKDEEIRRIKLEMSEQLDAAKREVAEAVMHVEQMLGEKLSALIEDLAFKERIIDNLQDQVLVLQNIKRDSYEDDNRKNQRSRGDDDEEEQEDEGEDNHSQDGMMVQLEDAKIEQLKNKRNELMSVVMSSPGDSQQANEIAQLIVFIDSEIGRLQEQSQHSGEGRQLQQSKERENENEQNNRNLCVNGDNSTTQNIDNMGMLDAFAKELLGKLRNILGNQAQHTANNRNSKSKSSKDNSTMSDLDSILGELESKMKNLARVTTLCEDLKKHNDQLQVALSAVQISLSAVNGSNSQLQTQREEAMFTVNEYKEILGKAKETIGKLERDTEKAMKERDSVISREQGLLEKLKVFESRELCDGLKRREVQEQQMTSKDAKIIGMQRTISTLTSEIEEKQYELERLGEQNRSLKDGIQRLEEQKGQNQQVKEELERLKGEFVLESEKMKGVINELKASNERQEGELVKMRDERERISLEYQSLQEDYTSQGDQLKAVLAQRKEELEIVGMQQMQEREEKMKAGEQSGFDREVQRLQRELDDVAAESPGRCEDSSTEERKILEQRNRELEGCVVDMKEQVQGRDQEIKELRAKMDREKRERDECVQGQLQELKGKYVKEEEEQKQRYAKMIEAIQVENQGFKESNNVQNSKLLQLQKDLEVTMTALDGAKMELSRLADQLEELKAQNENLEESNASLKEINETMGVKEQEGLRRLQDAEDEMEGLRTKLSEEMQKEIKKQGEFERIEKEFKEERVQLERQIREDIEKINGLMEEIQRLKSDLAKQSQEMKDLQGVKEEMDSKLDCATQINEQLEDVCAQEKRNGESNLAKNKQLSEELMLCQAELHVARESSSQEVKEIVHLKEAQMMKQKENFEEEKKRWEREVDSLRNQIHERDVGRNSEMSQFKEEQGRLMQSNRLMKEQNEQIDQELRKIREDSKNEMEIARTQAKEKEQVIRNEWIQDKEAAMKNLEDQKNQEIEKIREELVSEMKAAESNRVLEGQNNELIEEISTLQGKLKITSDQIRECLEEKKNVLEELAKSEGCCQKMQAELDSYAKKLKESEEENQVTRDQIKEITERFEETAKNAEMAKMREIESIVAKNEGESKEMLDRALNSEKEERLKEKKQMQEENEAVKKVIDDVEKKMEKQQVEIRAFEDKINSLEQDNQTLQKEKAGLFEEIQLLKSQFEGISTDHQIEIADATRKNEEIICQFKATIEERSRQIQEQQEDIQKQKNESEQKQKQIEILQVAMGEGKEQLEAAKQSLQGEILKHQKELDEKNATVISLKGKLSDQEQKMEEIVKELKGKESDYEVNLKELQTKLEEQRKEGQIQQSKGQGELEKQLALLAAENKRIVSEKDRLERVNQMLEEAQNDLEEELETEQMNNANLQEKLDGLEQGIMKIGEEKEEEIGAHADGEDNNKQDDGSIAPRGAHHHHGGQGSGQKNTVLVPEVLHVVANQSDGVQEENTKQIEDLVEQLQKQQLSRLELESQIAELQESLREQQVLISEMMKQQKNQDMGQEVKEDAERDEGQEQLEGNENGIDNNVNQGSEQVIMVDYVEESTPAGNDESINNNNESTGLANPFTIIPNQAIDVNDLYNQLSEKESHLQAQHQSICELSAAIKEREKIIEELKAMHSEKIQKLVKENADGMLAKDKEINKLSILVKNINNSNEEQLQTIASLEQKYKTIVTERVGLQNQISKLLGEAEEDSNDLHASQPHADDQAEMRMQLEEQRERGDQLQKALQIALDELQEIKTEPQQGQKQQSQQMSQNQGKQEQQQQQQEQQQHLLHDNDDNDLQNRSIYDNESFQDFQSKLLKARQQVEEKIELEHQVERCLERLLGNEELQLIDLANPAICEQLKKIQTHFKEFQQFKQRKGSKQDEELAKLTKSYKQALLIKDEQIKDLQRFKDIVQRPIINDEENRDPLNCTKLRIQEREINPRFQQNSGRYSDLSNGAKDDQLEFQQLEIASLKKENAELQSKIEQLEQEIDDNESDQQRIMLEQKRKNNELKQLGQQLTELQNQNTLNSSMGNPNTTINYNNNNQALNNSMPLQNTPNFNNLPSGNSLSSVNITQLKNELAQKERLIQQLQAQQITTQDASIKHSLKALFPSYIETLINSKDKKAASENDQYFTLIVNMLGYADKEKADLKAKVDKIKQQKGGFLGLFKG